MPEYTITWSIDIDGDNPFDAVRHAVFLMQDSESTATIFEIEDREGHKTHVDLLELVNSLQTEDGYRFYKQLDGSYCDHYDSNKADMLFNNLQKLKQVITFNRDEVFNKLKSPGRIHREQQDARREQVNDLEPKIAITLEGGIVQAIVSDQPSCLPNRILVVDYDDGWEEDDLSQIAQDNGSVVDAHLYAIRPELPRINLDSLFMTKE